MAILFCLLVVTSNLARAGIIWDESVNGDFPSYPASKDLGNLSPGANVIIGSFTSDFDAFRFTVPVGETLDSIRFIVTGGTGNFNSYFISGDVNGPIIGAVNFFPANQGISLLNSTNFANPVLGPQGPGLYSFDLRGLGSSASYQYTLVCSGATSTVPEPATMSLMMLAMVMLGFFARWQSSKGSQ